MRERGAAFDMRVDERVDGDSRGPCGAVLVVALEIHRGFSTRDAPRLSQHEARHHIRVRGPCVEHDAVAVAASSKLNPRRP